MTHFLLNKLSLHQIAKRTDLSKSVRKMTLLSTLNRFDLDWKVPCHTHHEQIYSRTPIRTLSHTPIT